MLLFAFAESLFANEVNIFSARHYDSDVQLYDNKRIECKTDTHTGLVLRQDEAV